MNLDAPYIPRCMRWCRFLSILQPRIQSWPSVSRGVRRPACRCTPKSNLTAMAVSTQSREQSSRINRRILLVLPVGRCQTRYIFSITLASVRSNIQTHTRYADPSSSPLPDLHTFNFSYFLVLSPSKFKPNFIAPRLVHAAKSGPPTFPLPPTIRLTHAPSSATTITQQARSMVYARRCHASIQMR